MTGMAGQIAAQNVNTDFVEVGKTLFANPDAYGPWRSWAGELPMDGSQLTTYLLGALPVSSEILSERVFSSFRQYARNVRAKRYGPEGLEIPILDVQNDRTGAISAQLQSYLSMNLDVFGKPINSFLISNPTCIDGSSLITTTHPFDSGGSTWSNSSSNSLTASELATVVQNMEGRLGETGQHLGIRATHLMVPSGSRQIALDITGSVRPVGVGTTGNQVTSGAVDGVQMPNWLAGQLDVIVNPYMTSGTWWIMALGNESVRPVYYGIAVQPGAHVVDDPQSEPVRLRSAYQYYAEGQAAFVGGIPQCIYGKAS